MRKQGRLSRQAAERLGFSDLMGKGMVPEHSQSWLWREAQHKDVRYMTEK